VASGWLPVGYQVASGWLKGGRNRPLSVKVPATLEARPSGSPPTCFQFHANPPSSSADIRPWGQKDSSCPARPHCPAGDSRPSASAWSAASPPDTSVAHFRWGCGGSAHGRVGTSWHRIQNSPTAIAPPTSSRSRSGDARRGLNGRNGIMCISATCKPAALRTGLSPVSAITPLAAGSAVATAGVGAFPPSMPGAPGRGDGAGSGRG
jgi:hypothetical protein